MFQLKTVWTERKRISKERLAVCGNCDRFSDGLCDECGCVMDIKTMFPDSECPLNKWVTEGIEENDDGNIQH